LLEEKKILKILSIVGPSASGKTTVVKKIGSSNFIIQEKYMYLNKYEIDNRLLLSKWSYINYWFENILNAHKENKDFLITDRCPLDTCAYVTDKSNELFEILTNSLEELKSMNIIIITVLLTANFKVLQSRIDKRILIEKQRELYNEKNIEHNLRAYKFFISKSNYWDYIIDSTNMNEIEVENSINEIIINIKQNS
jgi:molybdopterin-guanine dinucleotide biosynthesis protein